MVLLPFSLRPFVLYSMDQKVARYLLQMKMKKERQRFFTRRRASVSQLITCDTGENYVGYEEWSELMSVVGFFWTIQKEISGTVSRLILSHL